MMRRRWCTLEARVAPLDPAEDGHFAEARIKAVLRVLEDFKTDLGQPVPCTRRGQPARRIRGGAVVDARIKRREGAATRSLDDAVPARNEGAAWENKLALFFQTVAVWIDEDRQIDRGELLLLLRRHAHLVVEDDCIENRARASPLAILRGRSFGQLQALEEHERLPVGLVEASVLRPADRHIEGRMEALAHVFVGIESSSASKRSVSKRSASKRSVSKRSVSKRADGRRMPPHNHIQLSLQVGGEVVEGGDLIVSMLEEVLHISA